MKRKKIVYTDGPRSLTNAKAIEDIFPRPEDLLLEDETIRVSINLTRNTVEAFKRFASEHDTKYQRVIRRLLDEFAARHLL
jgi:predicted DNA binding CopG/RHH family protein